MGHDQRRGKACLARGFAAGIRHGTPCPYDRSRINESFNAETQRLS